MCRSLLCVIVIGSILLQSNCLAKQVEFTIRLDYPLLQSLVVSTLYTDEGQTAQLVDESNGCVALHLSNPRFSGVQGVIHFTTDVFIHGGTPLGESCLLPFKWYGSVKAEQIPRLDNETWKLDFQTTGTELFNEDGEPLQSLNVLLRHMVPIIDSYVEDISIDLAPPVDKIKGIISPFFDNNSQMQADQLVQSMKSGTTGSNDQGITAGIYCEVEEKIGIEKPGTVEELSDEEWKAIVDLWEAWDSLLVLMVTSLSEELLTDSEKQLMIDLILDTRHQFVTRYDDKSVSNEFIREQFVHAWNKLSPLFRRHLLNKPAGSELGYFSFFTAADALLVLDELGPQFGIELSRDGFVRLARIISGENPELHYQPDLNRVLQELFDAYPEPVKKQQQKEGASHVDPKDQHGASQGFLGKALGLFATNVFASDSLRFADIARWRVLRDDLQNYLERVRGLLASAADAVVQAQDVRVVAADLFRELIPAVAWQESCFRQFVVKGDKLTYLLSYNGTSVGIMQVNERVWRGIYDRQRLRWDIEYNAQAGCEIAGRYLEKYILRKADWNISTQKTMLAQLVYAMYNGGPAQYDKFLERKERGDFYLSDKLFADKFDWVKSQAWTRVSECL